MQEFVKIMSEMVAKVHNMQEKGCFNTLYSYYGK